jgi:hypothetical protein
MTYKDQIKSPKWQKKRLEILNLRGFKCEKCNCDEKQLHVHHRFYLKNRKAWEYDNDVFQVLCYVCHENEHNNTKTKNFELYDYIFEELKFEIKSDKMVRALEYKNVLQQFIEIENEQYNYDENYLYIDNIQMLLFVLKNGSKKDRNLIYNLIEVLFDKIYYKI